MVKINLLCEKSFVLRRIFISNFMNNFQNSEEFSLSNNVEWIIEAFALVLMLVLAYIGVTIFCFGIFLYRPLEYICDTYSYVNSISTNYRV